MHVSYSDDALHPDKLFSHLFASPTVSTVTAEFVSIDLAASFRRVLDSPSRPARQVYARPFSYL